MAVSVKQIDENLIEVNGKRVFKDAEERWICQEDIDTQELAAFNDFKNQHLKVNPKHN